MRSRTAPPTASALVSRLPVREWHVRRFGPAPVAMPLMVPGVKGLTRIPDEPRVALAAVVDGPRGPITVVTAHLSFVPGWNVAQLRALTRWALALPAPRLIVGDFNLPGAVARMASRWVQLARVATYPSYRPRVQFDHAFAHGIHGVGGARRAGDAAAGLRPLRRCASTSRSSAAISREAPQRPRARSGSTRSARRGRAGRRDDRCGCVRRSGTRRGCGRAARR